MRLRRLEVAGFGPLRGEFHFDPERLSLLVDENERGKSSMLAAITAALYGLPDDRRAHRALTPRERWRPWAGGPYAVELELDLEASGERLTIRRDFEADTVEIRNRLGVDVTAEYRRGKDDYPVGVVTLGLDAEAFEKCALVRQGALDGVVPDEEKERRRSTLHERLERTADTHGGDTSAAEALRAIDQALTSYACAEAGLSPIKVDTAIQRLSGQTEYLDVEIAALESERAAVADQAAELDAHVVAGRALAHQRERLREERDAALAADARGRLAADDRHRELLAKHEREAAALEPTAGTRGESARQLHGLVTLLESEQRRIVELEQRIEHMERQEARARDRRRLRGIELARALILLPGWIGVALGAGLGVALLMARAEAAPLTAAALGGAGLLLVLAGTLAWRRTRMALRVRVEEPAPGFAAETPPVAPGQEARSLDALLQDLTAARRSAERHRKEAVAKCREIGVEHDPDRSWMETLAGVESRVRQASRHEELTARLIPACRRELLDEPTRAEYERWVEAAPPGAAAGRGLSEIQQELDGAERDEKRHADARARLEREIGEVLDRYGREHPERLDERDAAARALGRARRFRAALELARESIQRAAFETHRRWAEFLDIRVGELLAAFGAPIQVRFGEDLDFAVVRPGQATATRGRALAQLSVGARDQLHLAVRLAISEFLARGSEPVPFLMDDVFATSDDDRVEAGMRVLLEQFLPRHQVLLVTCHRARFDRLAARDPDRYSGRVQRLEIAISAVR